MFEKVNPSHPDKLADRIAGALVDYAYTKEHDPRIAAEVLLGHGKCHICIARIVGVDHMGVVCLVEQQIHKTGILMRESVVVLTPHVAGQ